MARPMTDTMTAETKATLAALTSTIEQAERALKDATEERHRLWVQLVKKGHSQSEVARASGVIRQAVGWALTHPPGRRR